MSRRPDLVDVWVFRDRVLASEPTLENADEPGDTPWIEPRIEILLMRRSPGRILSGIWQCVSGSLEDGETVPAGALRELVEETGFGPAAIAAFFSLDQVNEFYEPTAGGLLSSTVFAVRVHPAAEPVLSHEHDAMHWLEPVDARALAVWPAYRESIRRLVEDVAEPVRARWFELHLDGSRVAR